MPYAFMTMFHVRRHYSPYLDPCGSCSSPDPGTPVTPPLPAKLHTCTKHTRKSFNCQIWWGFLLTPQHLTRPVRSKWPSRTNGTAQPPSHLSHEFPTGLCFKTTIEKKKKKKFLHITPANNISSFPQHSRCLNLMTCWFCGFERRPAQR